MASPYIQPARGIRKVSAIIVVAAAATPENLYLLTQLVGTNPRTVILRKIMTYSNVGNCNVDIGTGLGVAFANIIPTIFVLNGLDNEWPEDDIPEVEVQANLTVQSNILGVQVQVEVEEVE